MWRELKEICPRAFIDYRIRKNESYAVDTNVIVHGDPKEEFFSEARITVYPVIIEELFNLLEEKCIGKDQLTSFLNRKNIRIVDNKISHYEQEFSEEIKRNIIGKNDAIFLTYSKLEGTCIVSFDNGVNEVGFRYNIPLYDMRVEKKLPYGNKIKYRGKWKGKRLVIKRQQAVI